MNIKSISLAMSCVGTLFSSAVKAQQSEPTAPNVVIMIADDISSNDLGCYGHPVIKTPNIDQLAQSGVRFTNAFLTASSCSPSRSSIITGRYPHNTGACELHSPIPENQVIFPKLLKEAGYYTAQAGKWHFGNQPVKPEGIALEAFDRTGGSVKAGGGKSGAELWVPYLQERPKNQPFFMWFAAHDAHRGWDNKIFLPKYKAENVIVPPYMVDDLQTREDLACYYNEVSRFDFFVGKVVDELKRQHIFENTLIIIMADNGRPFPRDKTRLFDSGIKTPFVVHCPSLVNEPGSVSESLLSVIDIAPTVVELAGAKTSDTFQGESFTKLLQNPKKAFRKYVFAEHNWHDYRAYERMVRTKDFLYIENGLPNQSMVGPADAVVGGAGKAMYQAKVEGRLNEIQGRYFDEHQPAKQFYNCANDSLQFHNLISDQSYRKEIKKMKKVLKKWKKETHDSQPSHLTKDWYSRTNGKALPEKGIRGEMPGCDKAATEVKRNTKFNAKQMN